eukprot:g1488.t1
MAARPASLAQVATLSVFMERMQRASAAEQEKAITAAAAAAADDPDTTTTAGTTTTGTMSIAVVPGAVVGEASLDHGDDHADDHSEVSTSSIASSIGGRSESSRLASSSVVAIHASPIDFKPPPAAASSSPTGGRGGGLAGFHRAQSWRDRVRPGTGFAIDKPKTGLRPTRSWRDRVRPGTGFAATDALNAASVVTTANPLTKEEAVVGREDLFV